MKTNVFVKVSTLRRAKQIILVDDGSWERYLLVVTKTGDRYRYPYTNYNQNILNKSGRSLTGVYQTGLEG